VTDEELERLRVHFEAVMARHLGRSGEGAAAGSGDDRQSPLSRGDGHVPEQAVTAPLRDEHGALVDKAFSAGLSPEEEKRLAVVRASMTDDDRNEYWRALLRQLSTPRAPLTIAQAALVRGAWQRLLVEHGDAMPRPWALVATGTVVSLTWTRPDGAVLELDVDPDGTVEWSYLSPRNPVYNEGGRFEVVPADFYRRAAFFCETRAVR
jgi:hypothetical protein